MAHILHNSNIMFIFEKLEVYKKAQELRHHLKGIFSLIGDKYIRDQLQRASLSIILNLAEGSAKSSNREKMNYYRIARGSAFECVPIIQELFSDSVINSTEYTELYFLLEHEFHK